MNALVTRWIEEVNDKKITKWILYLSSLEENEKDQHDPNRIKILNLEKIRQKIKFHESLNVPQDKICDVLKFLSQGDLLNFLDLGDKFSRAKDPILLDFLKVWGQVEVEKGNKKDVHYGLLQNYGKREKRSLAEYKGYLGEIHMSQVLLSGQNKTLPGKFFHAKKDILPIPRFIFLKHRYRLGSGLGKEVDFNSMISNVKFYSMIIVRFTL